VFIAGTEILQSHDPKLVLLATAICALGSFITLFLFAQAREQHAGRSGWLFLAGFSAGAVIWTTNYVALLTFYPNLAIAYDPALTGGAFFVAVLLATVGLAVAAYGPGPSGLIGGAILGFGVVATHFTSLASMHTAAKITSNPTLLTMGAVLCVACGMLAVGRARNEGRNVQFIAPVLMAAGIAIMHFVGMAAIDLTPDASIRMPMGTIDPTILGYFVGAMTMLLVGTGAATTVIARGARKEAQTQLKNIADASVEGLILTDGLTILDINESVRALVGSRAAARLVGTRVWQIFDYMATASSNASRRRYSPTTVRSRWR
jgi:NO-binding membrane sensor protein with MHYT domain